jgi:FG-GAP-like repeat
MTRFAWLRWLPAALLLVLPASAQAGFAPAPGSPVTSGPAYPYDIVTADMNGDGRLDLVTSNYVSPTISVLLGDGAGGFAPADGSPFATGIDGAYALDVGDVDRDGRLDVATVSTGSKANARILLGDGTGRLAASGMPFETASTNNGVGLRLTDLNRDQQLDLAVLNNDGLVLFLGDGAGTFTASGSPINVDGHTLGAADLTGDGTAELLVPDTTMTGSLTVLTGDAATGLSALSGSPFPTGGSSPGQMGAGDVNGDGTTDVVLANGSTPGFSPRGSIRVFLGGAGTLTPAGPPIATGSDSSEAVRLADFNADGRLDAAVTNETAPGSVSLLLGDGAGGFAPAPGSPFASGADDAYALAVGDLNGDLQPDLASTSSSHDPGTVSVLLNTNAGSIAGDPDSIAFGTHPAGERATRTITLSNSGDGVLRVNPALTGGDARDFEIIENGCGGTVMPGASCEVRLGFTGRKTGRRSSSLRLDSNAPGVARHLRLSGTVRPPVVRGVRARPATFAVGTAATPLSSRVRRGTTFRFRLSEAARVLLRIERRTTRRHRVRHVRVLTGTRPGSAGVNRVAFSGRTRRGVLAPGRYRLVVTAVDRLGGRSVPRTAGFRVVPAP